MKLINFFLMATVVLTLSSCSSDDDGNTVIELTNASIAGTYELTYFEGSSEYSVVTSNGSVVVTEFETFTADTFTNATYTFNEDGTYVSSGSFRITYEITVTGEDTDTESLIESLDDSGTYSVNTTSKTITIDGDVNDVKIFNGDKLTITGTDTDVFEGETEVFSFEIRLQKQ